ncbi:MAG TPA: aspartate kinase [Candidatus Thermoplasmatota archaeon]|nr:aspartate kinase [Candidatus Thermoplasmatota archaeon]
MTHAPAGTEETTAAGGRRAAPTVLKFGGAGLRDGAAIRHAASLVASHPGPRLAVASALEGVTDLLLAAQDKVRGHDAQVLPTLEALRRRHLTALQHCAPGDDAATYAIESGLQRLERLLYGIAYTEERTERLHDLVQSFGERLAAPLLAAAVRAQGVPAVAIDAEHAGLRTLGPYGDARVDLEAVRREAGPVLRAMLDTGQVPVVTGYYGVDTAGNATLFGRGGSDFVAAVLAHAVEAQAVELWKDVAGFLTADPRLVPTARWLPELGYDEAAELALNGAKVLHARCVEPVQAAAIPIRVRSLAEPQREGTVIRDGVPDAPRGVRSLTHRAPVALVRIAGAAGTAEALAPVTASLQSSGVRVLAAALGGSGLALAVASGDEAAVRHAVATAPAAARTVEVRGQRSLLGIVGRGIPASGAAAKVLETLAHAGVPVEMVAFGASQVAVNAVVPAADAPAALRALHRAFLEGAA